MYLFAIPETFVADADKGDDEANGDHPQADVEHDVGGGRSAVDAVVVVQLLNLKEAKEGRDGMSDRRSVGRENNVGKRKQLAANEMSSTHDVHGYNVRPVQSGKVHVHVHSTSYFRLNNVVMPNQSIDVHETFKIGKERQSIKSHSLEEHECQN